ncbi:MAG: hypothetical protein SFH39_15165 [Candidatus Magnetobacterium sp. LHC-1]|uniref:hypothetical protein n=1 Tax=Candidatus Magnetobacterium casense TaxID=1455061 RepID=UPI00058EE96E|nr:hypothetical protein [Candidatus Magnetobacterium casensis]MBF0337137.1 hypothetical protein [Nitrospirota bacterium]
MNNEINADLKMPMFQFKAYAYNMEYFEEMRKVPLKVNRDNFFNFLDSIADKYPFMVIIGLRVLTEIAVKEILEQKGIPFAERDTLSVLIDKLCKKEDVCKRLKDFSKFENIAAHGYEIPVDIAKWALDVIPYTLNELSKKTHQT